MSEFMEVPLWGEPISYKIGSEIKRDSPLS